jgi:hypothetical protein
MRAFFLLPRGYAGVTSAMNLGAYAHRRSAFVKYSPALVLLDAVVGRIGGDTSRNE